jgi:hypothetical protein
MRFPTNVGHGFPPRLDKTGKALQSAKKAPVRRKTALAGENKDNDCTLFFLYKTRPIPFGAGARAGWGAGAECVR